MAISQNNSTLNPRSADEVTLGLLQVVEDNSQITQRSIADELNIALGLTNAYLKRCVKKGFIKVSQAPASRYAYYLTPTGFAEKSRLTAEYLSQSFNFFRLARNDYADVFGECVARGLTRVAFCGASDLCEIASLYAKDHTVVVIGVIDWKFPDAEFADMPIIPAVSKIDEFDAAIITDLLNPQQSFDRLTEEVSRDLVFAPKFLKISRHQPRLLE
jgi:predicted transcriptional regulator